MAEEEKCEHFDYCGAYIIRERIGDGGWTERFCFGNPEKCIHFEDGPAKKKISDELQKSPAA